MVLEFKQQENRDWIGMNKKTKTRHLSETQSCVIWKLHLGLG